MMDILNRRKEDPRNIWRKKRDADETEDSLLIPPCEHWFANLDTDEAFAPAEGSKQRSEMFLSENKMTPPKATSQCWAFMGSVGGAGTTTLAIQTAYQLAQDYARCHPKISPKTDPKVCLIDLDFENGSCLHHLDIEPRLTLEDLTGDAKDVDETFVLALMSTHKSGISVLATQNVMGANNKVNPHKVAALLEAVCKLFPHVVLDLPRQSQGWTLAALGGSDFIGIVADLTIPSLHMARTKRMQIAEKFEHKKSCEIILNKYERRMFRNSLQLADAELALQSKAFSTVCADPQTTQEALNCGEPAGLIGSESRYAKDCRKLINLITDRHQTLALGEQIFDAVIGLN